MLTFFTKWKKIYIYILPCCASVLFSRVSYFTKTLLPLLLLEIIGICIGCSTLNYACSLPILNNSHSPSPFFSGPVPTVCPAFNPDFVGAAGDRKQPWRLLCWTSCCGKQEDSWPSVPPCDTMVHYYLA